MFARRSCSFRRGRSCWVWTRYPTGNALNNTSDGSKNTAANVLAGGSGDDTYSSSGDSIIGLLDGGIGLVQSAASVQLQDHFENLTLTARRRSAAPATLSARRSSDACVWGAAQDLDDHNALVLAMFLRFMRML